MTSLLSLAWPRTLTLLAITLAWPATRGVVRNSAIAFFGAGAFFSAFFFGVFFFSALAAGALVGPEVFVLVAEALVGAAAGMAGAGGALVTSWAGRLPQIIAAKIRTIFLFI